MLIWEQNNKKNKNLPHTLTMILRVSNDAFSSSRSLFLGRQNDKTSQQIIAGQVNQQQWSTSRGSNPSKQSIILGGQSILSGETTNMCNQPTTVFCELLCFLRYLLISYELFMHFSTMSSKRPNISDISSSSTHPYISPLPGVLQVPTLSSLNFQHSYSLHISPMAILTLRTVSKYLKYTPWN